MLFLFILLFLFDVAVGVLVYFGWQRVREHLRNDPAATKVMAEIIASLLTGKTENPEVKKTRGGMLV